MSDAEDLQGQVRHLTRKLQTRLRAIENQNSANCLHWGQFVLESRPDSQVGVYGSACATFILQLECDDEVARRAAQNLADYLGKSEAELELAHNIKLAMVCLALAPSAGGEASSAMQDCLKRLLERCTNSGLWPAYSRPATFQGVQFTEQPTEVASAVVAILLTEIQRRLTHQAHVRLQGEIGAVLKLTATSLENAHSSGRTLKQRHGSLIATVVIMINGARARSSIHAAFKDAVQSRDFADRRVFFYDCLRPEGTTSRDYFILPAATLLSMVAGAPSASAMQRALAIVAGKGLLGELDDDGVFKGGQELPSTVEQGMTALALTGLDRGLNQTGFWTKLAEAWLYMTQSSPTGRPTVLVKVFVYLLWFATAIVTMGHLLPDSWRTMQVLGPFFKQIYLFSTGTPGPVSQFLAFFVGILPVSRAVFTRLIKRDLP